MGHPFEADKLEKLSRRDEILDAAGQLFSRQGFHATSMRDLARAVNLQGGSLYAHIESKEEVLFELVNHAADKFLKSAQTVPANLSPKEHLAHLIRGHLEVIACELDNAKVFFTSGNSSSQSFRPGSKFVVIAMRNTSTKPSQQG